MFSSEYTTVYATLRSNVAPSYTGAQFLVSEASRTPASTNFGSDNVGQMTVSVGIIDHLRAASVGGHIAVFVVPV